MSEGLSRRTFLGFFGLAALAALSPSEDAEARFERGRLPDEPPNFYGAGSGYPQAGLDRARRSAGRGGVPVEYRGGYDPEEAARARYERDARAMRGLSYGERKPLLYERTLSLCNLHTGEAVRNVIYWDRGRYVPDGIEEISYLLRDHRTNEIKVMDPAVLDILLALRYRLGQPRLYNVVSGYRSPKTNAMLREHTPGVARKSMHVEGKAVDIRVPGVDLAYVRRAAVGLHRGGVGYYPQSDFIHVDSGRVRQWS